MVATHSSYSSTLHFAKFSDEDDPATEAIHALVDFHHGRWRGRARSFTVTPDVAAGIVQRQESPEYVVSVQAGQDFKSREYKLMETLEWGQGLLSARQIKLNGANMDVDSVDASYSLDVTLPDFPATIAGTDKLVQFMVEHCIATGADERVRSFVLYGANQQLLRIVVCQEQRVLSDSSTDPDAPPTTSSDTALTARDLLEMQDDIDRLVDRIADRLSDGRSSAPQATPTNKSSNLLEQLLEASERKQKSPEESTSTNPSLSLHTTSLLEVSSGVWLGDAIIRQVKQLPSLSMERGRGFGGDPKALETLTGSFAQWSVGVQKVAWRWMWNFGDEIRQVNDAGRSLGSALDVALSKNLAGSVCVNEGLSRRIPPKERMVFVDWAGDNVGFLVGPAYIQVPRYLNFDRTREIRPFYTEFCVFQCAEQPEGTPPEDRRDDAWGEGRALPSLVCSKISRVYSSDGRLKQGCTAFFSFKRFGVEADDS